MQDGLDAETVLDPRSRGPLASFLPIASVALLNPAVPPPQAPASEYATLGASHRVRADPAAGFPMLASAHVEGDPATLVYRRRTGLDPDGAQALHLGIAPLVRSAGESLGILAESCRAAGVSVGVLSDGPFGPASLLAMDHDGRIDVAFQAPKEPIEARATRCLQRLRGCDLLIVAVSSARALAAQQLTAALLSRLDLAHDSLVLCSPIPASEGRAAHAGPPWDRLGLLLAWGPHFPPARLDSATTRTAGLVANIDLTPTLLDALGASRPDSLEGHPMRPAGPAQLDALRRFAHLVRLHAHLQFPLYFGYGAFGFTALLLSALLLRCSRLPSCRRLGHLLTVLVTTFPLALLLVPQTYPSTVAAYLCALGLAVTAILGLTYVLARWYGPPLRAALLLMGVSLLADLLFNRGAGNARSIFSDFPLTGMRFYGMGNEYMALTVASMIVALTWRGRSGEKSIANCKLQIANCKLSGRGEGNGERSPVRRTPGPFNLRFAICNLQFAMLSRSLFALAALLIIAIIGHPAMGANFGGPLTAIPGFGVAALVASGRRLNVRTVGALLIALVAVGVLLFVIDYARPEAARSHVGDLAHQIARQGAGALLVVVVRKLGMNWRILQIPWLWLWLAIVAFGAFLCYHAFGARARALMARRPDLYAAQCGLAAAALAGAVVNDSGVVVAAYIGCVLLALLVSALLDDALT